MLTTKLTIFLTASIILVAIFPSIYWIIVYPAIFFAIYYFFQSKNKNEQPKHHGGINTHDQSESTVNYVPFATPKTVDTKKTNKAASEAFISSVKSNLCDTSSLQKLLAKGADINFVANSEDSTTENDSKTSLHFAVENSNEQLVSWLLSKGANAEVYTKAHRFTPLHLSVANGQYNIAKVLLSHDPSAIQRKDIMGNTPIVYTILTGNTALFQLLHQFLTDTDQLQLLEERNAFGLTPLHTAVAKGNIDMVKLVIHAGVNVNILGKGQFTALHSAVCGGDARLIQLLLTAGAAADQANEFGWTALHYAIERGFEDVVVHLLERYHVNVEAVDKYGYTPLHLSVVYGEYEIFDCLLQHHANSAALTKQGKDLLQLAASNNVSYLRQVCKFNITSSLQSPSSSLDVMMADDGTLPNSDEEDSNSEQEEEHHRSESQQIQYQEIKQMIAMTLRKTRFRIQTQKSSKKFVDKLQALKVSNVKNNSSISVHDID